MRLLSLAEQLSATLVQAWGARQALLAASKTWFSCLCPHTAAARLLWAGWTPACAACTSSRHMGLTSSPSSYSHWRVQLGCCQQRVEAHCRLLASLRSVCSAGLQLSPTTLICGFTGLVLQAVFQGITRPVQSFQAVQGQAVEWHSDHCLAVIQSLPGTIR